MKSTFRVVLLSDRNLTTDRNRDRKPSQDSWMIIRLPEGHAARCCLSLIANIHSFTHRWIHLFDQRLIHTAKMSKIKEGLEVICTSTEIA